MTLSNPPLLLSSLLTNALLVAGVGFRGSAPFSLAVERPDPVIPTQAPPPPKRLQGMPRPTGLDSGLQHRPQRQQHAASQTGSPSSVMDTWMPGQAEEEGLLNLFVHNGTNLKALLARKKWSESRYLRTCPLCRDILKGRDLQQIKRLLPSEYDIRQQLRKLAQSSCAVVGASSALRNCTESREICDHDVVIHVNDHPAVRHNSDTTQRGERISTSRARRDFTEKKREQPDITPTSALSLAMYSGQFRSPRPANWAQIAMLGQ